MKINIEKGLSNEEVQQRINNNQVNFDTTLPSRNVLKIVNSNVFTLFNFLNLGLAIAVLFVGSFKNIVFIGIVFLNTIIGIIQELNAKRIIDKLSLILETKPTVIRNGEKIVISLNQLVIDDLMVLNSGKQIVCDAKIVAGTCEVNESLITGESEPIYKQVGDKLLSGSFIVSGEVKAQVIHVGKDNYSSKIMQEAKVLKNKKSVLMLSLNKIIKVLSIVIIPLGIILFLKQLSIDGNSLRYAVINTVAALVGMIPEGLILLTSTVLAVSVVRLVKQRVLIQQLYSVETLARIDTICLDKTGTLTSGDLEFFGYIKIDPTIDEKKILSALVSNLEKSDITKALEKEYKYYYDWKVKKIVPFSSSRKYSGISFFDYGSLVIGAPEFVLKDNYQEIKKVVDNYSKDYRVLLLAKSNHDFINNDLPSNLKPLGLILLRDNIRGEARKTLDYFQKQDVDIKIISGDNILTVLNVARRLGLKTADKYIDASTIKDDVELEKAIIKYNIFGRVSPEQKQKMVKFLQNNDKIVGFVGDGVNDVLALKIADCGVAMASGSEAARNASELILLDSNFDAMPHVVAEGRRTVNNIERSATLFLVKTIYATAFAILFLFISRPYPFEPIQYSLTSVFTIGIPSLVLAIEPNKERIKGKFLTNVISRAMPTALTNIFNIILIMIIGSLLNFTFAETSTLAVILSAFIGFMLLWKLCQPFNFIRMGLMVFCVSGFLIGVLGLPKLFSLSDFNIVLLIVTIIMMIFSIICFNYLTDFYYYLKKKYKRFFD